MSADFNNYQRSADKIREADFRRLSQYSKSKEEISEIYREFQERFSPNFLNSLEGSEILYNIFLNGNEKDSLCHQLEYATDYFGSIAGGAAFKYGLFQSKKGGKWKTGYSQNQVELEETQAILRGQEIRDCIIAGWQIIHDFQLATVEDYEALDRQLTERLGKLANYLWIRKYYHMMFPDKFSCFYSEGYQKHVLYGLGIRPSKTYCGRSGQLALLAKDANLPAVHFAENCKDLFGNVKHFYRLGSSDDSGNYAERWQKNGMIAIGWPKLGDLQKCDTRGILDRRMIAERLSHIYYNGNESTSSRKAGEIKSFYEADADSVFVVMDGGKLFALVDNTSAYYYDSSEPMAHCKHGVWHMCFAQGEDLPETEGYLSTCTELKKENNLLFLYDRYYQMKDYDSRESIDATPKSNVPHWLLTWNPSVWEWSDFQEAVKSAREHKTWPEEWRCANTHVKSGDRIFLTMLGTEKNGVIASGFATSEPFECPHWDSQKADAGQKINRIKIAFDKVLDYRNEEILSQKRLQEEFPDQKWNPQGSGIAIKDEYCMRLEEMWKEVQGNAEGNVNTLNAVAKPFNKQDFLKEVFMTPEQYDELEHLLEYKKNIILQGAPGVGKTFMAKKLAYSLMGERDESCISVIQFHQSYSYEDFIMGYKPTANGGFELKKGVFYKFCKEAEKSPSKKYFFIIDEINRGNLSKIFGELLMLIEKDKRGEKVKLAYNDELFSVPENIYIIGMMNTADRSLAMMDYALRRRFSFFDVEPAFDTEMFRKHLESYIHTNGIVERIIKRFGKLNQEIADDLGRGYRIGHSYFCEGPNEGQTDDAWYESIIKYEVSPLLDEYWWDDKQKAENCKKELLKD